MSDSESQVGRSDSDDNYSCDEIDADPTVDIVSDTSGSDKENQNPSSQVSSATPQKTLPHNYTPIKKSELKWLLLLLLTAPKEP